MGNWNNFSNTLNGYGYSVQMPPGFMSTPLDPMSGGCFAWPLGSTPPPNSPALVWLLPIMPAYLPGLIQHYYNFDNPMIANFNAQSLGLMSVTRIAPLRQTMLNGASALVREFDAMSINGQPIRMSALLLQGPYSALQCIAGINLYRWVEFAGSTLQFVANVQMNGTNATPGEVRTLIDKNDLNHVEMQLVNADQSQVTPIMNLPTSVGGRRSSRYTFRLAAPSPSATSKAPTFRSATTIASRIRPREKKNYKKEISIMSNIKMGNVSGTNLQVGDNNTQNITINQQDRDQIVSLLNSLHQQIQQAPIPEQAKQEITQQVLPSMQEAVKQPDPKPGLTQGLEHLNANLQKANTAASSVSEIVGTVSKIAGIIGVGVKVAAPFLAGLL